MWEVVSLRAAACWFCVFSFDFCVVSVVVGKLFCCFLRMFHHILSLGFLLLESRLRLLPSFPPPLPHTTLHSSIGKSGCSVKVESTFWDVGVSAIRAS